MTLSRLLFTLLIVLAAVAQLGRAIPTGGTEEAATENKTPEGHKTKEQLLEEYVHQTKEGDCHEGHCNACKSEEACVATGACMWCATVALPRAHSPAGCGWGRFLSQYLTPSWRCQGRRQEGVPSENREAVWAPNRCDPRPPALRLLLSLPRPGSIGRAPASADRFLLLPCEDLTRIKDKEAEGV